MSELDLSYLNEISGGDEDFIKEMIETFLEETPKDLLDVEKHLASKDWSELGKTAHKMKSSIKMFGYETLKEQALFIEKCGKSGTNTDGLELKVRHFINGINTIIDELKGKL